MILLAMSTDPNVWRRCLMLPRPQLHTDTLSSINNNLICPQSTLSTRADKRTFAKFRSAWRRPYKGLCFSTISRHELQIEMLGVPRPTISPSPGTVKLREGSLTALLSSVQPLAWPPRFEIDFYFLF